MIVRHLDLVVLALALPVFILADWPLAGYTATAVAWLAQAALSEAMLRRAVKAGERKAMIAMLGGSIVARLWLVTGAALVVGLSVSDEAGLAAAILAAALVTAHLISEGASRAFGDEKAPVVSRKGKVILGFALYFLIIIALGVVFGSDGKNEEFQPQNEFKLEPWVTIEIGPADMSINKAVLYLFIASALTIGIMSFVAKRMQREPNHTQMAVELAYDLTKSNIAGNITEERLARKWFPYLAALFFFIWFSNMIGYLPLPTNTEHTFDLFGLEIPSFAIYAATANISIPLVLAMISVIAYHIEGIRAKGVFKYFASWLPPGLESMNIFGRSRDLHDRGRLAPRAGDLAVGSTLRQYPRRPPADPLHGGRTGRAAGIGGAGRAHVPDGIRLLRIRNRPGGNPPGLHLLDANRDLHWRRHRRRSLGKTRKRSNHGRIATAGAGSRRGRHR